ncbi:hypothetical protein N7527_007574 [Penicillium freii]|nr:hypothetical protein N7527_007574 [Penicillium freii]
MFINFINCFISALIQFHHLEAILAIDLGISLTYLLPGRVTLKGSMQWSRDLGDSHPVYSALTLLTPGRTTLKRLSPISHPGDTHRTIGHI